MAIEDKSTFELPNDPAARKKIIDAVKELCDSFTRQDAEKDLQKDIGKRMKDELKVKKGDLMKLARWKYNEGTKDKTVAQIDSLAASYEVLFQGGTVTISQSVVDASPDPVEAEAEVNDWPYTPGGAK